MTCWRCHCSLIRWICKNTFCKENRSTASLLCDFSCDFTCLHHYHQFWNSLSRFCSIHNIHHFL